MPAETGDDVGALKPGAVMPSSPAGETLPEPPRRGWRRWRPPLGGKEATHGIYVEIVVLAVIIAIEGKRTSDADVLLSLFGAIIAIVLAELYASYLGMMLGSGRRPSLQEMAAALASIASSLVTVIPPILLVVLGVAGVIRLDSGFTAAKWAGVAVIGLYALAAHRRAGLSTRRSIVLAGLLATVGFGLVLLKQFFH